MKYLNCRVMDIAQCIPLCISHLLSPSLVTFSSPALKDGSPRLRKTYSTKESKSKRKSATGGGASSSGGSGHAESKALSTTSSSSRDSNTVPTEDMSPEDVNVTRRGKCHHRDGQTARECCNGTATCRGQSVQCLRFLSKSCFSPFLLLGCAGCDVHSCLSGLCDIVW